MTQIPAFYRDNSITPLGPDVQSSQFDDGTRRGLRIYCSTRAAGTVYDDDGASNDYRQQKFATTLVSAQNSHDTITVSINGAVGSYTGEPTQRQWQVELYCTHPVSGVTADDVTLAKLDGAAAWPPPNPATTSTLPKAWCTSNSQPHQSRSRIKSRPPTSSSRGHEHPTAFGRAALPRGLCPRAPLPVPPLSKLLATDYQLLACPPHNWVRFWLPGNNFSTPA